MADDATLVVAVIGAGKMAFDCIGCMLRRPRIDLRLVVTPGGDGPTTRRLAGLCHQHRITILPGRDPNDESVVAALGSLRPDLVFSINNLAILGPGVLDSTPGGVVNFHNGPLPRYAGINIPTWVIWNDEVSHGVTWHFVSATIDGGNILCQRRFPLTEEESAAELMFRCIVEGVSLFEEALEILLAGERTGQPQTGARSYYRRGDRPNDGVIDVTWSSQTVRRFLRAYDYRPFPSPVGYPRVPTHTGAIHVGRGVVTPSDDTTLLPGTVIRAADDIVVRLADGALTIRSVVDRDGHAEPVGDVVARLGLRPGLRLPAVA